ncbi:MAG: hypothetical protein LBE33_00690 [Zoogloeaceae bacterium]|jgi:hypothetical protein|nr:hypothetical protein [Zoogloeaceae bacterium]
MDDKVWTPTRQSNATRAFMSVLRLRSLAWGWVDAPALARWWVIDSTCDIDVQMLALHYDQMLNKPEVAFLVAQPGLLPRPAWTLFKIPVKSSLIFDWIGRRQFDKRSSPDYPAASVTSGTPWRQGLLRLKRWPNPARYGNTLDLIVACSRLLGAPATYAQVLTWGVAAPLLDRMLQDAFREGLLDISNLSRMPFSRNQSGASAPVTTWPGFNPAQTPADTSRWNLIKQLLGKFSFK